ncbi:MAG: Ig-like domain-containing protein [Oscillospiraceae bacterium]|nr:Ig-like domain-containing protein [Oscillospiraceae bacterium]
MYNIKANAPHGKVTGTGYYVHGSKVNLTASANKGYKVKSITLNGKTYKGNKVSFTATKSLTVKVNYTTLVTSIKLNKKSKTMKKGESFNLKAAVNPKKADNKKLTWQSSNKRIATVTQKGRVTAKKAGKCTIKAIAKDGSGTFVKCKITVKK